MKFGKTSDSSGESLVYELSDEVRVVFDRLEALYRDIDVEFFYAFRCLPDSLNRKTMRRFAKAENVIYMDLSFSQDRFKTMSRDEQRHELSHKFYAYTDETLRKYRIPGLDVDSFLADLKSNCQEIGWLKEEWEVDL